MRAKVVWMSLANKPLLKASRTVGLDLPRYQWWQVHLHLLMWATHCSGTWPTGEVSLMTGWQRGPRGWS